MKNDIKLLEYGIRDLEGENEKLRGEVGKLRGDMGTLRLRLYVIGIVAEKEEVKGLATSFGVLSKLGRACR